MDDEEQQGIDLGVQRDAHEESVLLRRPASTASNASTDSSASDGSSSYATASCRSSLSDISVSTLGISLPETPQPSILQMEHRPGTTGSARGTDKQTTPGARVGASGNGNISDMEFIPSFIAFSDPISPSLDLSLDLSLGVGAAKQTRSVSVNQDTPTKSSPSVDGTEERRRRARSQTVMNAKHVVVDMKKTAVGRTMSLQPSKAMVESLRMMEKVPAVPVPASSTGAGRVSTNVMEARATVDGSAQLVSRALHGGTKDGKTLLIYRYTTRLV